MKRLRVGVLEIAGITASQADVEVSFRVSNLEGVELIDEQLLHPQLLCSQNNASVNCVFGPFGLLVLASEDLTEQTAFFFRIFNQNDKHIVLMCTDQSRSSLQTPVKQAIFGSFLDADPDQEISLRTLVDHSIVEFWWERKELHHCKSLSKASHFQKLPHLRIQQRYLSLLTPYSHPTVAIHLV